MHCINELSSANRRNTQPQRR